MSRNCLSEMQSNASLKQRSGKGGGRGSDIRREATAEQSGYRPCRFDALRFTAHHAKTKHGQINMQLLKRRRNSRQPRSLHSCPNSSTLQTFLQRLRTHSRTVHRLRRL